MSKKWSFCIFTCVKQSKVPKLLPQKGSTVKALAEARNFLPDESNHFSDKTKNFQDFSVEVITHFFNGAEIITNSSENKLSLKSEECLQVTCIAKFFLKIYPMFNFEAFHCGVKCSVSTLPSNRVNLLNRLS